MQERHKDRELYFKEQAYTTERYVIPFINDVFPITKDTYVCEIGCGEGGNIQPFLDIGCRCVGIDINEVKIELAKSIYSSHQNYANLNLVASDIYDIDANRLDMKFDVIIMRDVIEHIHNQDRFMEFVQNFLKPNGIIFLGFPPWQNPFGGHQQIGSSILSKIPFVHLLPLPLYRMAVNKFENGNYIVNAYVPDELLEIRSTGISIERFHKIIKKKSYRIIKEVLYLINPNYEIKFKLKQRILPKILRIPIIRNFLTTAVYIIISPDCKQTL